MVKAIVTALLLASLAFAETTTKLGTQVPTDQAKAKLLSVVVHQQQVQLQMKQLEEQYKGLAGVSQLLMTENLAAQKEVLKSAGADEKTSDVSISVDGNVTIVPKPEPKKEEKK